MPVRLTFVSPPPPKHTLVIPSREDIGGTLLANSSPEIQLQLPTDILLITVKEHEFNSCYSYLQRREVTRCYFNGLGMVDFGKFGDGEVKVALIMSEMGPMGASRYVRKAVEILRPRVALFVGFCATLNPEKAKLGDVAVSAKLVMFASKKITANRSEEWRGAKVHVSKGIRGLILTAGQGWAPPLEDKSRRESIKVHRQAVMLSGPELIDCSERRNELHQKFPDAIALDMEGEGIYEAADDLEIEWAVIKGISDLADGNKASTGSWQPFASAMAASVVYHMFKRPEVIQQWPHYRKPVHVTEATSTTGAVEESCSTFQNNGLNSLLSSLSIRTQIAIALFIALVAVAAGVAIGWYPFAPKTVQGVSNEVPPVKNPSHPIEEFLESIAGTKRGKNVYNDRTIEYYVFGTMHSIKERWVFGATAKDFESGIAVEEKYFDTADEAISAAIKKLVKQLKDRKIMKE